MKHKRGEIGLTLTVVALVLTSVGLFLGSNRNSQTALITNRPQAAEMPANPTPTWYNNRYPSIGDIQILEQAEDKASLFVTFCPDINYQSTDATYSATGEYVQRVEGSAVRFLTGHSKCEGKKVTVYYKPDYKIQGCPANSVSTNVYYRRTNITYKRTFTIPALNCNGNVPFISPSLTPVIDTSPVLSPTPLSQVIPSSMPTNLPPSLSPIPSATPTTFIPTAIPYTVTPIPSTPQVQASYPRKLGPGRNLNRNIFLVIADPVLSTSGKKVHEHFQWNDPDIQTSQIINWFKNITGNKLQYTIKERVESGFLKKLSGFTFDSQSYIDCIDYRDNAHCRITYNDGISPNADNQMDYNALLAKYNICDKVNRYEIDEVWIYGAPYFSLWEANMAGKGAWDTNGPAYPNGNTCNRPVHIMGFSYEVGYDNALHNFGHRVEGTMRYVNNYQSGIQYDPPFPAAELKNDWDKFSLVRQPQPPFNFGGCGNVHCPPNTTSACGLYDLQTTAPSTCDDFYNFPNLTNPEQAHKKIVTGNTWGNTQADYFNWWFDHLPPQWWNYAFDADEFRRLYLVNTNNVNLTSLDITQDGKIDNKDYKSAISLLSTRKTYTLNYTKNTVNAKTLSNILKNMGKQLWHRHLPK